jgi:Na+/melibiose symporter-like transporter
LYFHCFVPAVALTNKIGLKHLADADAEYPRIRIFGTAGWITAGLFLGFGWPAMTGTSIEATRTPLLLGAFGSVVMMLYALTLPYTPPERDELTARPRLFHDRGALIRNRPLVMFLLVSMLACAPSMAYNNYGNLFLNHQGYPRPAALMTLGQVSDLIFLWASPWFIARFGLRTLFVSGVTAWAARYSLLAAASHFSIGWPVYAAILIHGPCYVFIYVIGVMYVDRLADPAHRGAAQGMYALATTGVGHMLGAFMVGFAQKTFLTPMGISPPPYDWTAFWAVPAIFGVVTLVLFKLGMRRTAPNGRR